MPLFYNLCKIGVTVQPGLAEGNEAPLSHPPSYHFHYDNEPVSKAELVCHKICPRGKKCVECKCCISFIISLSKLNFQQCLQERRLIKGMAGSGESSGELKKKTIQVNGVCNLSKLLIMIFLLI